MTKIINPVTETDPTAVHITGDESAAGTKTFTGIVQIGTGAGSTTVPSFRGYDTDTGISFTNNNTISIIAASVARLTITNAAVTSTIPVSVPSQTTTTPAYRINSSSSGLFGSESQSRIGLKMSGVVIFDAILSAGLGASKFQYIPLKAEAGFSAGLYDAVDLDFLYVSNGSFNSVDTSGGATTLYLGDDLSDPVVVGNLEGAQIIVKDTTGNANVNNITIDPQSFNIDEGNIVTIDRSYGYVVLVVCNGFWSIAGGEGYTLSGGTAFNIAQGSGTIFDHYADANNGTTVETDLYSDTLPASILNVNGDKISAYYGGIFTGAAAATQQLKIYFGGTLIYDSGALSIGVATNYWTAQVECIRVSSSVVRCNVSVSSDFATLFPYSKYTEVTGLTLTNTQIIKCTGQAAGAGGASNQITAKQGSVDWKSAA